MALTLTLESSSGDQVAAGAGAGGGGGGGARERMFEKVVTPSDVGKLNRLVVPKHLAEKHLPVPGAAGTVLCFHDARCHGHGQAAAPAWRFRYSYWSSSQSYVMTKGWSRYVRDKRLAAGDTVSFCRDGATSRLFIDCRRRVSSRRRAAAAVLAPPPQQQQQQQQLAAQQRHLLGAAVVVDNKKAVAAAAVTTMQEEEEDEARRRGRCLRLFGVNLELQLELRAEPLLLDLQL